MAHADWHVRAEGEAQCQCGPRRGCARRGARGRGGSARPGDSRGVASGGDASVRAAPIGRREHGPSGLQQGGRGSHDMEAGFLGIGRSGTEQSAAAWHEHVGIFRRGRYAAGKRVGKGNVIELGDQVKKGSPVGFIEQLGTHFPVEAPQTGELARFKLEDGAPVEYGQIVAEVAPFFGGELNVRKTNCLHADGSFFCVELLCALYRVPCPQHELSRIMAP
eukprot:352129-Chlamydomonas_euryale.AAC.12